MEKTTKHGGSKRTLKDKICPWCNIVFRPISRKTIFCKNECRLKSLHKSRHDKSKFFNVVCWSEEEDNILKNLYPDRKNTIDILISYLPGRTKRAIEHRLHDVLKVKREGKQDLNGANNPFFGKTHTDETKRKLSLAASKNNRFVKLSKDLDFQKKRRKALGAKPNKLETILDGIINEICPNTYQFVGDGKFLIDGLNPDWVCEEKRKVIELFGRAFHDQNYCQWKVPYKSTETGRREVFDNNNYKMLVIWDVEMKKTKLNEIKNRIIKFTENE